MRAVIGWKSLFYQRTKHRAELKLSRHLPNFIISDLFQDFPLAFFSLIEVKFWKVAKKAGK